MTLRPVELLDACVEVAAALAGQRVQKVVQPSPHAVLLGFPAAWLAISVDGRAARVHLVDRKPPGTGEAAPAFCMLLRAHLVGARLVSVEAVPGERACAFDFSTGARLLAFLFGAGGRLVVVGEEGRALGAIGPGKGTPTELPPPRPPRPDEPPSRFPSHHPSPAIAEHFAVLEARLTEEVARARAAAETRRAVEKLRRREAALIEDLARVDAAADRRRHADLLLAHLHEVPRGTREVTLPDDFSDGKPILIPLDPALSPQDNAARLYKQHQRLQRGRAQIESRLVDTRATIRRLSTGDPSEPRAPGPKPRHRPPAKALPYRQYRSATGATILVGRDARRNDDLTFHVARGNDLWMHARDAAGAHVVVLLGGRPEADHETLLDAATLAIHFSPARDEAAADVTWTHRKHVRKPRGGAPGLVTVAGGRTLRIRMDPERLRRLLAPVD